MAEGSQAFSDPESAYAESLQALVEKLVAIDLEASPTADQALVDAGYRTWLQSLVTETMRDPAKKPDLQGLLDSALQEWAARP